jgi:CDGSH-type Zn-finger protein|tara:strand:+ start:296 stop:463 length:168 start_codon:yes stop_codon:yes gene_type:complete
MPSDPQVVTVLKVSEFPKLNLPRGKKAVYCRCWKSGTFPLCDAAHVKHNKETGDK